MQYLLSEEEYEKLTAAPKKVSDLNREIINQLCIDVATNKPIKYWGNEEARIWGCPRSKQEDNRTEYCDECPVQEFCTQHKSWSK